MLASQNQRKQPGKAYILITQFKLGTLNLCLGLFNKKELVKNTSNKENVDKLCLEDTKIEININHNLPSFPSFIYEFETNSMLC